MLSCGVNGQLHWQFVGRLVEGAIHVLIFHIILFVVHASSHSNNSQPPPRHPHPVLGPCQNAVACHHQLEEAKHAAAGDTSTQAHYLMSTVGNTSSKVEPRLMDASAEFPGGLERPQWGGLAA